MLSNTSSDATEQMIDMLAYTEANEDFLKNLSDMWEKEGHTLVNNSR